MSCPNSVQIKSRCVSFSFHGVPLANQHDRKQIVVISFSPSLFLLINYSPLGEERDLILEGVNHVADDSEDSEEHDHDNGYHVVSLDHCGGSGRLWCRWGKLVLG